MEDYAPIEGVKGFSIESTPSETNLYYKDNGSAGLVIKIQPHGKPPKTGLYLSQQLKSLVKDKKVLDLGTGESAILALFGARYGAKAVVACDVDKDILNAAKDNSDLNNLTNIKVIQSNLFTNINEKFDLIVSNPPQLPMLSPSRHDSGGQDGRLILERIINQSPKYLNERGQLVLLVFDFLGVDRSFNHSPSLFELLKNNGFSPTVLSTKKRLINPKGQTYKNLHHITETYPKYTFTQIGKNLYHYIMVVKAELL